MSHLISSNSDPTWAWRGLSRQLLMTLLTTHTDATVMFELQSQQTTVYVFLFHESWIQDLIVLGKKIRSFQFELFVDYDGGGGGVVTPSKLCLEGCQGHVSCQECKLCSYTSLSGSCYVTWCKNSAFDPHVLQLADQCSALASQSLRVAFLYMPAVGIRTLTPLPCGGWFVPFGHKKPFCLCLFVSVSVID